MSKWITGHKIIANKRIQPIELFQEYVQKGLQPYDQTGNPITPVDIVADINSEQIASADRTPRPFTVEGSDKIFHSNEADCLSHNLNERLGRLSDSWKDFSLSATDASSFLKKLTDCLFLESAYKAFGKDAQPKQPKQRPNQRHKLACQEIADGIWAGEEPGHYTTVVEMSEHPAIIEVCEGHAYGLNTFYQWFKDKNPDKSPGRRPKKN